MHNSYEHQAYLERQQAQQTELAKKLIDGIQKLYAKYPDSQKRWIWELIQNAHDSCRGDSLKIQIDISDNEVVFKHSGSPFKMKELVDLIEQTSSKSRKKTDSSSNDPDVVGHYGTGFLTTHLLSKKVKLESVFHDTSTNQYKRFSVKLDRSPNFEAEMLENVRESISVFQKLDNHLLFPFLEGYIPEKNLDTVFVYSLESDDSKETIKCALEYFERTIAYSLTLNSKLKEIVINHSNQSFTYKREAVHQINNGTLQKIKFGLGEPRFIYTMTSNDVKICLELIKQDNEFVVKEKLPGTPSFYVNFPLIGSEDFELPFVVHSSKFEPNEERSTLLFSRGTSHALNKRTMEEAVNLYSHMFKHLCSFEGSQYLAYLPIKQNYDFKTWLSLILKPFHKIVYDNLQFLNAKGHRVPFRKITYIYHKNLEMTLALNKIMVNFLGDTIPMVEEKNIIFWTKFIDNFNKEPPKIKTFELEYCIKEIASYCCLDNLNKITGEVPRSLELLNDLFKLKSLNQDFVNFLIFPNEHGVFCKEAELFNDDGINETLKDIAFKLGKDFRQVIIHKGINYRVFNTKSEYEVVKYINSSLSEDKINEIIQICRFIPVNERLDGERRNVLKIAELFVSRSLDIIPISQCDEVFFIKSDKLLVSHIASRLERSEMTISQLQEHFANPFELIYTLISTFKESLTNRAIFPNTKGELKALDSLRSSTVISDLNQLKLSNCTEINNLLLEILFLTGKDTEMFIIDPLIGSLVTCSHQYSLENALQDINKFLENKNNYFLPKFSSIFKNLQLLEKSYYFNFISEYNKNRNEMFYQIVDEDTKCLIISQREKPDFVNKLHLIKDIDISRLEKALKLVDELDSNTGMILERVTENNESIRHNFAIGEARIKHTKDEIIVLETKDDDFILVNEEGIKPDFINVENEFMGHIIIPKYPTEHQNSKNHPTLIIRDPYSELLSNKEQNQNYLSNFMSKRTLKNFEQPFIEFQEPSTSPVNTIFSMKKVKNSTQATINSDVSLKDISIEKAVSKVLRYLKTLKSYDFSQCLRMSKRNSNILKGVLYNRNDITIIVKSALDNCVIFDNMNEASALSTQGAQIWIDVGSEKPVFLSVGKLIINSNLMGQKIPV
jgi:hypothetical protein